MRQAASYRAAAADRFVADQGQRGRQQRHGSGDGLGFLGHVLPRHGAYRHLAVCGRHPGQFSYAVDVDEHRRVRQPQRQQRDQALAAGEHARLVLMLREQRHSLGDGLRRLILNVRQFHQRSPSIRQPCFHIVAAHSDCPDNQGGGNHGRCSCLDPGRHRLAVPRADGRLRMVGRLRGLSGRDARRRADELLARFDLADAGHRRVNTYSGGMRRRLDLAAALVARPPVLFLDEPTTGLDPRSRLSLWETIERLVSGGTTVLLTTQYLDEAEQLADRIAILHQGRIIVNGTLAELKQLLPPAEVEYVEKQPSLEDVFLAVTGHKE